MKAEHCPVACASHRGPRASNQDAVIGNIFPDGRQLVALADGMGGHAKGEIASAAALEALAAELMNGGELEPAVRAANGMVRAEAERRSVSRGMGTTLVAVLRAGAAYRVANVGDSRAYRVDRTGVRQVTVDHSFIAEAVRAGGLSPEEAGRSPWRHAVTRSLGTDPDVEVDVFGPFDADAPPHAIVLCSDGLYKELSDDAIRRCVLAAGDVRAAADALCGLALERGTDDNVSVAVLEFGTLLRGGASVADVQSTPTPKRARAPASAPRRRSHARFAWEGALFFTLAVAFVLFLMTYLLSL